MTEMKNRLKKLHHRFSVEVEDARKDFNKAEDGCNGTILEIKDNLDDYSVALSMAIDTVLGELEEVIKDIEESDSNE